MKVLSSGVIVSVVALALALIMTCPMESRAGQASESQTEAAPSSQDASPKATDSNSFALLHVYRQRRYMGNALAPSIYVDGTEVAGIGNGRRVTIKLVAGKHTFTSVANHHRCQAWSGLLHPNR